MAIRNLINYLFAMLGLFSAVAISVHGIGAVYIAVWLFFALLFFLTHKSLSGTFFTPLWLILPLFYIIHLVGMLYTQNIKSGKRCR